MSIIVQQETCNTLIDYSTVEVEERVAPFSIASTITLLPNGNQRFCYTLTATGQDNSTYVDLSHFVFTICPDIMESDLLNVTVVINGQSQIIGEDDVEVFTPPAVDPPTGCSGLKFDFGLGKTPPNTMTVCFELADPVEVGPVDVCLFGGNITFEGLAICGPLCGIVPPPECDTTVFQTIDVCVPVTVTASADVGDVDVICCGNVEVSEDECDPEGDTSITFYIRRRVCAIIPIDIDVDATGGTAVLELVDTSLEECLNCDQNGGNDGM